MRIDVYKRQDKEVVKEISIEPASEQEMNDTVQVMGGEDWRMWICLLYTSECPSCIVQLPPISPTFSVAATIVGEPFRPQRSGSAPILSLIHI